MAALRACLDRLQAARDGKIDRLIIAGLEVEHGPGRDGAPVTAEQPVAANHVEGARDRVAVLFGKDEQNVVGHPLAQQGKGFAV